MTPYDKRINPFIQRMADDMQLRNDSPATIDSYTFHVDKSCRYFGKPADQLGPEQIRQFQLYLVKEKKVSWSSSNQAVCGLRFMQRWTLHILPKGFTRSRSFGGYHGSKRKAYLQRCHQVLGHTDTTDEDTTPPTALDAEPDSPSESPLSALCVEADMDPLCTSPQLASGF